MTDPKEVEEATKLVEHRQKTLGEPSGMALLSRLHWWTVEYGTDWHTGKPQNLWRRFAFIDRRIRWGSSWR